MVEESNKFNLAKHMKTPSLRDLMLGKKIVKNLPDNFFEKVLELEIKLKKGFNMDILQELVAYYSVIIFLIISVLLNIMKVLTIQNLNITNQV
jgi:hypothetical protein